MDRQVTIIILTWNGIEYTKKCLKTLHDNLNYPSAQVIVVDNGSTDGTVEYLRSIDWITPVFNKQNLGFVRANNMGIEMASPESDIILVNNDIEIHDPHWIEKLQTTGYEDEKIGIVGCRIRRPDGSLQHAGTYMPNFTYRGYQIGGREKDINQYSIDRDVEGVVFACVYIKSSIIQKIGGLSTDYFSYYEDTDYCLAAKETGFRVLNCGSLTVLHHEHVATKINRVDHDYFFLKSQKVFKQKWMDHLHKRFDKHVCWHSTFDRPYGYGMISRNLAISMEDHGIGVPTSICTVREPFSRLKKTMAKKIFVSILSEGDDPGRIPLTLSSDKAMPFNMQRMAIVSDTPCWKQPESQKHGSNRRTA